MEKTALAAYFGVPVLVQLRIPLVIPMVKEHLKMQHADDPENPQWIPQEALEEGAPGGPPVFSSTQMIRYAVLNDVDADDAVEVRWLVPGVTGICSVATLLNDRDIAAVTRIVSVPPAPPAPPEPSRIIMG
jgi:hypothetical protein